MWIHLKNEKEKATLNLNFTLFFSVAGLDHKKALKQIINFYGCSIDEVSLWFETAIEEFHEGNVRCNIAKGIPKLDKLEANYEYFKKTFISTDKSAPIIRKIYEHKPKFSFTDSLDKAILQYDNTTVVMIDSMIMLIYNNIYGATVKEQYNSEDKLPIRNAISDIIEDIAESKTIDTVPFKKVKNIANAGYIQIENCYFDVQSVIKLLDSRMNILIGFNPSRKTMILTQRNLTESRKIILKNILFDTTEDIAMVVKLI